MVCKKIYFCEKKKAICITDSCTEGQELQSIPNFDVPIISRTPSPGLPDIPDYLDLTGICPDVGIQEDLEWNTGIWKINEPQMDQAEYQMIFKDGTEKTWKGKLNFMKGCDKNKS